MPYWKMSNPTVSIFMITYNHEGYIRQAIDSVLMQQVRFDYELVIGEDCSTDGTAEIVRYYAERHPGKIKAILNRENMGQVANAIQVFKSCTGEYIAFLEGDDYWTDPQKLQKQVDFLEKNPGYGLVHTDLDHLLMEKGKLIKNYNKVNKITIPEGDIFYKILNPNNYIIKTVTALLRRKTLFENFNFDVPLSRGWKLNDLSMWLTISKHSKVGYIPESTATYRVFKESASQTDDVYRKFEFHKSVFDIRFYYWEKYCKRKDVKDELDRFYHYMLLGDAYQMQDKGLAKNAFDYFKKNKLHLPFKHKVRYSAVSNGIIRFFYERIIKFIKFFNSCWSMARYAR